MGKRATKPEWNGQHLLPGMARARSRRVWRNGKRRNAETDITGACLRWMQERAKGVVAWAVRTNAGMARGFRGGGIKLAPEGFPDIAAQLVDGRACCVETKCAGEKLSPVQQDWKELIEQYGGVHVVAHSEDECAEKLRAVVMGRKCG